MLCSCDNADSSVGKEPELRFWYSHSALQNSISHLSRLDSLQSLLNVPHSIGLSFFCFFAGMDFQLCCRAWENGVKDCDFLTETLIASAEEDDSAGRFSFAFSVFSL
jgi:hypothetical protein